MDHELRERLAGEVRDGLLGRTARPDAEGHGGRVTSVRVGQDDAGEPVFDVEVDVVFNGPGIEGQRATWHGIVRYRDGDRLRVDDDTVWIDMR